MDKQAGEEQPMDEQAKITEPEKVQVEVSVPKPQVEKPTTTLISSSQTLTSTEYGLESKVEEMSKIDHSKATKSIQYQLKKVLPTDAPDFGKIKLAKDAR
ncbi:hypothetical protein Tco_1260861 [Tanacetum coccineum]